MLIVSHASPCINKYRTMLSASYHLSRVFVQDTVNSRIPVPTD